MTTDGKKIIKYLKRLQSGDKCFDELIYASIGYVGYVAYKNLVDKSYLSDVISETYANVIRYITTLKSDGNPLGWLCRIAQNEAYKINKLSVKRNEDLTDDIEVGEASRDDAILEVVDLYRAMDRLDETERKVVERIYFDCKPYREIATELDMSLSNVYYVKKSALKKLLIYLSD